MKSIAIIGFITISLIVSACNTVKGVGQDISGAGQAISGASENTKHKISR